MLKKILFVIILMIVIVALNWFEELIAQDFDSLPAKQQLQLLNRYRMQSDVTGKESYYRSPEAIGGNQERDTAQAAPDEVKLSESSFIENEDTKLRPFGIEFFSRTTESTPPADVASMDNYVLGPGDNLIIFLWGRVEKEYNLTVDREGKLFIPTVGELTVWGLTLKQFKQRAEKRFGEVFSDFQLTCSLGKIRSIRIYITGEVNNPGAYTVSSLTSLFNALSLAGGPNERGSMRTIRLMRQGKAEAEIDLYRLLLEGDNSTDIRLESGDVIFVPVAGARVAVKGEVKRPAVYELKGGETARDLLHLAGNATAEAYLEHVSLERVSDHDQWEVLDLNLSSSRSDTTDEVVLQDGDHIMVNSIFNAKKNLVAMFGLVKHPGYFERTDSTRVSDVLSRSQLQPYDVYMDRADLFRRHTDRRAEVIPLDLKRVLAGDPEADILLADHDSIHIYSIDDVTPRRRVYIEGEVNKPGWYPFYDGMTVADLIFLAGSFKRSAERAQAELARIDEDGGISLTIVSLDRDSSDKALPLHEDDHLFIRKMSTWKDQRVVHIDGEVRFPGKYMLSNRSETLCELLNRAGGYTADAFPKGLVLERESIVYDLKRSNIQELLAKSQPLVVDSLGLLRQKQNEVDYDPNTMKRIIIDTDQIADLSDCNSDIVLKPNDRIFIPTAPTGIPVIGAVGANGTIGYREKQNAKYYIKRAGDFTRQADKKEVRIVRAGGEVVSGGVLSKQVELGDMIVVPTRIEKDRNWGKSIGTWLSAATGVLTSVYIVSKL